MERFHLKKQAITEWKFEPGSRIGSTKTRPNATMLRIHLPAGTAGLAQDSNIMIDQLRAIDNRRLLQKIGFLPAHFRTQIDTNLKIVLDLP